MQRVPSSLPSLQGQRRPEGRLTERSLALASHLTLSSGPHGKVYVEEGGWAFRKSSGVSGMRLSNRYFRPPDERYLIPKLVCRDTVGMEKAVVPEVLGVYSDSTTVSVWNDPRHLNRPIRHNPAISPPD